MSERSPILIEIPETLDGPRVQLRRIRAGDAPVIAEAITESLDRLKPWMPWAHSDRTLEDTRLYAAHSEAQWLLRESLDMLVVHRETGRYLGNAGFPRLRWDIRSFEIGYWLRTSAEGQGFMREAVQLLTRLAFDVLDANRVEIQVDTANARSSNVARRLGFLLEGTLRNSGLDGYGRPSDRHVFALTPSDYRNLDWGTLGMGYR